MMKEFFIRNEETGELTQVSEKQWRMYQTWQSVKPKISKYLTRPILYGTSGEINKKNKFEELWKK